MTNLKTKHILAWFIIVISGSIFYFKKINNKLIFAATNIHISTACKAFSFYSFIEKLLNDLFIFK